MCAPAQAVDHILCWHTTLQLFAVAVSCVRVLMDQTRLVFGSLVVPYRPRQIGKKQYIEGDQEKRVELH